MLFYLVAFGVLAHVFFWGAGLAMVTMPRPWRSYWPVLAAPAGCVLQSLVVWIGSYADLPGTDAYAWGSEAIPLVLLLVGVGRRGWAAGREWFRFRGLWFVSAASLLALVHPLAVASKGLTTASLGGCDAADYAAGARVLMQFAHHDRSGFLGLTEVVGILSVDNFYDFWLRLNHFTPSAMIALNGTIFDCAPHELTGLMAAVTLVGSLPVVYWLARALLGYRGWASLGVAALYGFSPVTWYAVYEVALGQLLAAPAIALITWAGVALWRVAAPGRRWSFFGILAIAYALVLGSYNFIVIVCLVPAVAYAAGLALWQNRGRHFLRWLSMMLLPLAVVGLIFWARVAGLTERFRLFSTFDFGWRIPALSPEGWLGMVRTATLDPFSGSVRLILALAVGALLAAAWWRGARRERPAVFVGLCLTWPVLLGYAYLTWRGQRLGTNASYDAYKLFAVFYPGFLAAICYWLTLGGRGRPAWRFLVGLAAVGVAAAHVRAAAQFERQMSFPPLIVDRDLIQVGRVEALPQVDSLNLRILDPDLWSRLWANEFLLRKTQYFPTHTYEGRRNTPLRGHWDLIGGLVMVELPGGGSVALNPHFEVVRVDAPAYFRAESGPGWYPIERLPRSSTRWQWTAGGAALRLENPGRRPLRVAARIDVTSRDARDLQLWSGGRQLGRLQLDGSRGVRSFPEFVLPPGTTEVELRSDRPPVLAPGDDRPLNFCIYGIVLSARTDPGGP